MYGSAHSLDRMTEAALDLHELCREAPDSLPRGGGSIHASADPVLGRDDIAMHDTWEAQLRAECAAAAHLVRNLISRNDQHADQDWLPCADV
jgi:hypothetical protein